MRASYSKVSTFYFCPKKYEYRYVLDVPAPPTPALAFGIAVHGALEKNFRQKILTRSDLSLEVLLPAFREELRRGLERVPEENLRGASETNYLRSMGEHFLELFMKERAPDLMPAPRGVECFFKIPLPGGHEISGKFDLMDEAGVMHDFKTSSKPYDSKNADPTQLVIYAWASQKLFGKLPTALCFDVFVKGDGAEAPVSLQAPVMFPVPTENQMKNVAQNLSRQIDKILDVQRLDAFPWAFEPARCHWCEYQTHCREEWEKSGSPAPVRMTKENLI